jgi:very-short-patch-repair endonuclease
MRSELTPSEQKLWEAIQVPLGRYIADFVAPSVRLVVEVDGRYHARRHAADARRDRDLRRMAYRVLRLEAALVERHLGEAVGRIRGALPA